MIAKAILAIAIASGGRARAQSAEAETLFREGKRLMKQGQIARACDKFEAGDRLEPTVGAQLNLADCREKNGQIATAWAAFVKAATTAKHAHDDRREAEARRRAAALESRLVYLVIMVPRASRIDGLVIKRNGTEIDPARWDQRVPVDPGEYAISIEAPDFTPWSTTLAVTTRSKTIEVPLLARRPGAERGGRRPATSGPDGRAPGAPRSSGLTATGKLSLVLAGVGVVGLGVGAGLGLHARSLESGVARVCPGAGCFDPQLIEDNRTAQRYALAANIGFTVGGVAIFSAAVLWFTGSPRSREAVSIIPTLGSDRVGIGVARSF